MTVAWREAVIDLRAFAANIDTMTRTVAPARVMIMVKADAYAHGLLPMARAAVAHGVTDIGSLDVASAVSLREAGMPDDITVFAWLFGADEDWRTAIEARVDLGISSIEQLRSLAHSGASRPARVHLKVDTGLHRNGASEAQWPWLVREAADLERAGLVELRGAWTHIAEASDEEDTEAIARFERAIDVAASNGATFEVRHLAASAAAFARADARLDLVRIGAFSYGISPGGGIPPAQLGLVPVMALSARVAQLVGRDGRTMAMVPIGTGDGILGRAAGRIEVAARGIRFRIAHVDLDRLELDVTDHPLAVGDEVVLFGPGTSGEPTLQEWGDELGTIGEEIVARVSPRIPRRYVGNE